MDDDAAKQTGPLSHLTVLDLSRVRTGPTAVRQLADWGARVIKIEQRPEGDADQSLGGAMDGSDYQNLHRNKRSLTLDLKSPEGLAVFRKLVAGADVVLENFRPDVKYRLGIDYETLAAINPRLVYASISGFGETGPYRTRPGFDQIAQGMGGIMSVTGQPEQGPMRAGIPVADLCAGLYAALGIFVALIECERSGKGQWVQSSLLQAQVTMMDFQAARWLLDREVPPQAGNNHPTSAPTGVFATRDGHINIAATGGVIFERLAKALDDPEMASDPDYSDNAQRARNRDALNARIETVTKTRTSADWVEALNAAGVPCGPIYAMDEVFADPQVQHLDLTFETTHPRLGRQSLVGQGVKLSRSRPAATTPTPDPGQHNHEILREFGFDAAEIAALERNNVI
ncbi:MAG: CoA transferase [Salinarimonas sp.]|nr:CoA transferase [Salinarimonas sp.]